MVSVRGITPVLEDESKRAILEDIRFDNIFTNLTDEENEMALGWYKALRKEEQLNINGVLSSVAEARLIEDTSRYFSDYKDKLMPSSVIVAGSSISGSYRDIDLFLLPRCVPYDGVVTLDVNGSPFFRSIFDKKYHLGLKSLLAQLNCFYGGKKCDSKKKDLPGFEEAVFGKGITLFVLQEIGGRSHDFRERRPGKPDDFLYAPYGSEALIEFNRDNKSKFLVLSRQYQPIENEGRYAVPT